MSSDLRPPWRISDAIWVELAALLVAGTAVALLGVDELTLRQIFGVVLPAQSLGALLVVAALAGRRRPLSLRGAIFDLVWVPAGVAMQIGIGLAMWPVISFMFDGDPPEQELVSLAADATAGYEYALVIVGVVGLGPVVEELVFRGVLLSALRHRMNDTPAIWWSAVVFAVIHLIDPEAYLAVPGLIALGWAAARLTVKYDRIWPAVALHAGFNTLTVLAIFID